MAAQQAVEIEKPVLVLRPHGDPAAVGGELVEEGAWQKTGGARLLRRTRVLAGEFAGTKLNDVVFKHTLCVLQAQGQVQLEDRCSGIASKFTGQTEKLYANGADTPQFVSTVSAKLRQDPSIDSVVTLGPALGVAVRPGRVVDIGRSRRGRHPSTSRRTDAGPGSGLSGNSGRDQQVPSFPLGGDRQPVCRCSGTLRSMGHPGEVLAYIEDGPHGGETVAVAAEFDGSAPYEIELQDPVPPAELYVESSLRHSIPLVVSRYRLVREAQRERGGYVYMFVRDPNGAR